MRVSKGRVIATIEGRLASTRLPGKIFYPLAGVPMIGRIARRAQQAKSVDEVVIATTDRPEDRAVVDLGEHLGIRVYCGSVDDISERLLAAAAGADILVQITGDCPLVDPTLIDKAIDLLREKKVDYVSNSLYANTYPIGFDVRVFTIQALLRSMELSRDPTDRIHGSYFIARRPDLFSHACWDAPLELQIKGLRLTVDEPADYKLISMIYEVLAPQNPYFGVKDVINLIKQNPDWAEINAAVMQKKAKAG